MIKEKFVSFEVAELLKKVGFKEPCTSYYSNIAGIEPSISKHNKLDNYNDKCKFIYSAPTQQMALAYLRVDGFHINASISYDTSVDADGNIVDERTFWFFEILSSVTGHIIYTEEEIEYNTYEEAVEAGLKYWLTLYTS